MLYFGGLKNRQENTMSFKLPEPYLTRFKKANLDPNNLIIQVWLYLEPDEDNKVSNNKRKDTELENVFLAYADRVEITGIDVKKREERTFFEIKSIKTSYRSIIAFGPDIQQVIDMLPVSTELIINADNFAEYTISEPDSARVEYCGTRDW